jgi:hypothetical protein
MKNLICIMLFAPLYVFAGAGDVPYGSFSENPSSGSTAIHYDGWSRDSDNGITRHYDDLSITSSGEVIRHFEDGGRSFREDGSELIHFDDGRTYDTRSGETTYHRW